MPPTYRVPRDDEHQATAEALRLGFGGGFGDVASFLERSHPSEYRVLAEGGELLTALRIGRSGQYWLGRQVPSAQVLQLSTPPQHRGQGHGLRLLTDLFAELREAGVPAVTLQPSNLPFYRAAGFEIAGAWNFYEAKAEHLPRRVKPYRARKLDPGDLAEVRALYERIAPGRHGALARTDRAWELVTVPRAGGGDTAIFGLDGPEGLTGWAVAIMEFRQHPEWGTLIQLRDWGCLPGAEAALFAVFAGYNAMNGTVRWSGPDPDPSVFLFADRKVKLEWRSYWMLRLVDLAAALRARPFPPGVAGSVAFTVDDHVCPWNSGDWSLEIGGGQAGLRPAPASPTARVHVRALAALFSGYATPADLVPTGLLEGLRDDDLGLLGAAFASPSPWTVEIY